MSTCKCPVCEGRGTVPATFYEPTGTAANPVTCRSCGGSGVWCNGEVTYPPSIWDSFTYIPRNSSGFMFNPKELL